MRAMLRKAGVSEDEVAPRSLRSPAQILKLIKGHDKLKTRLEKMVTKTTPALHVAPEADARSAVRGRAALDFVPVNADNTPRKSTDV